VSILVADVRGFSLICEDLEPEQVIAMLNTYLEVMTAVIEDYGGTIDEFVGDAILVLFGAPLATSDHAERAVACALGMQLAMRTVNERNRVRDLPELEIGIGVHTGEAVVGNIGSIRRAKYGAVGASMNLASRLESYTVGGQILISDETRKAAGEQLVLGSCVHVEPKGVHAPLAVYEVLGLGGTHGLTLPRAEEPLQLLREELPCEYFVMEEKIVGRTVFRGSITHLSRSGAELRPETPLALLANLKLRLIDNSGEIYAKVVGRGAESALNVKLRFTSIAPAARTFIEESLVTVPA
jgi:adenylate cyclase